MNDLVVFDFDGVLADTLDVMLHIVKEVCEDMGYPCTPSPDDLNSLNRMEFIELGRQLGIPEPCGKEFVERTFHLFSSQPLPPRIFPGMREVLIELAKENKIGILTGNASQVVDRFLKVNDLSAAVTVTMSADIPGSRSEKLGRIIALFGQREGNVYLVGDAVSDIQVARESKVTSIAVTWGHQSEAKLRSVEPDHLVHTPLEILMLLRKIGTNSGDNL